MAEGKRKSGSTSSRGSSRSRAAKGRGRGAAQQGPRTMKQRIKRVALWGLITSVVLGLLGVTGLFILYRTIDIPKANDAYLTQTTKVYYANGKSTLGQYSIQERESIPYEEMPQTIKDAVVAAENRTFFTDPGLDFKGIVRAAFSNAQGNSTQGASTITQQYVKLLYLTQERTIQRKVKEAFISLKIKNQLSKKQILEGYLNTVYFGRGAYGVQAAAQAYFATDAADLDLGQSAMLAALINNPVNLDPAKGEAATAALTERYRYVLSSMVETGKASEADVAPLRASLPPLPEIKQNAQNGGQRGHVLAMVRKELERLGFSDQQIDGGGLQVTTTFTRKAMKAAADGVREQRPEGFSVKDLHVGVASVEPGTGAVRGIYAGQDFLTSQLNWAVEGGQAGSTFKPFALAAGLEAGFELKDTFDGNSPLVLPDGTDVENQGDQDYGSRVNLIKATEDSINTAFIDMTQAMPDGPEKIIATANAMGIPPAEPANPPYGIPSSSGGLEPNLGVGLGPQTVSPINMANGYATIANRGEAAEAYIIEKVVDAAGVVRYSHKVTTKRAISEGIADDVSYAMQQVVKAGSGTAALPLRRPAAGKTGTATNGKGEVSSAWFVGFTPQLSTAVMYVRGKGNEQLKDWLPSYFGGAFPARTWTAVMERALEGADVEQLPPPAYVKGEAPSDGHEPAPPPPPKPKKTPKPTPTQAPTPTPVAPTTPVDPLPTDPGTVVPSPTAPTTAPTTGGILGLGGRGGRATPAPAGRRSPRGRRRRTAA